MCPGRKVEGVPPITVVGAGPSHRVLPWPDFLFYFYFNLAKLWDGTFGCAGAVSRLEFKVAWTGLFGNPDRPRPPRLGHSAPASVNSAAPPRADPPRRAPEIALETTCVFGRAVARLSAEDSHVIVTVPSHGLSSPIDLRSVRSLSCRGPVWPGGERSGASGSAEGPVAGIRPPFLAGTAWFAGPAVLGAAFARPPSGNRAELEFLAQKGSNQGPPRPAPHGRGAIVDFRLHAFLCPSFVAVGGP